jgi:hypothetical protein
VSPHDSTGANLVVQVKAGNRVMRVLPLENEAVNECWIADRDRFSYEALNGDRRLTQPMIKQGGAVAEWWTGTTALEYVARMAFGRVEGGASGQAAHRRPGQSPTATAEELYLLGPVRAWPGQRERRRAHCAMPTSPTCAAPGSRHAGSGTSIASLSTRAPRASSSAPSCARIIRCFAQRIRQAARRGAQVHSLHALHDDWLMPMAGTHDRRAVGLGRRAGRDRCRRGVAKGARRRWPRGRHGRAGRGRIAAVGRTQGAAAGQRRRAAPAGVGTAGAGQLDRDRPAVRRSATWATPPTRWARSWSVRCRGQRSQRRADAVAADEGLLLLDVEPGLDAADAPRPAAP